MTGPGVFSEKLPQHRHCVKCGKAFVGDGEFCSEACRTTATDESKKKLRKLAVVWVAIVVVTVGLVIAVGL